MTKHRKKRHEEEEHADETWLVPYSDILTLLLALFIVLFASSQIDVVKFQSMESSFKQAFSGFTGILYSGHTPIPNMQPPSPQTPASENAIKESAKFTSLQENINKYITENHLQGKVDTMITDEAFVLVIKDEILFRNGRAKILPAAIPFLQKISDLMGLLTEQIAISGHTDNQIINTEEFPSNWDLSSQRAVNMLKAMLNLNPDLNPQRFSAVGYGSYKPIVPNITPENRSKNRRVEIAVIRTYPIAKQK